MNHSCDRYLLTDESLQRIPLSIQRETNLLHPTVVRIVKYCCVGLAGFDNDVGIIPSWFKPNSANQLDGGAINE